MSSRNKKAGLVEVDCLTACIITHLPNDPILNTIKSFAEPELHDKYICCVDCW